VVSDHHRRYAKGLMPVCKNNAITSREPSKDCNLATVPAGPPLSTAILARERHARIIAVATPECTAGNGATKPRNPDTSENHSRENHQPCASRKNRNSRVVGRRMATGNHREAIV
jgi:hypothetical protein